MGFGGHLVPAHQIPRAVAAKDRVGRVLHVSVGVVGKIGQHFLGIVAGIVPGGQHGPAAQAVGVGGNFPGIAARGGYRQTAGQRYGIAQRHGRLKAAAHPLHIGHRAAQAVGRQCERKLVPRFQQLHGAFGFGHPQALPHRAVGGLAEVTALGVLLVGAACRQRDFYIGQRRADQHAGVGALGQVRQHQTLPVFCQAVRRAVRCQLHAAAARAGLQQQVHLGIMAQRFVMADALNCGGEGLLVQDAALAESDGQLEALLQNILQNFQLHFAHQLHMHLGQIGAPGHMQLRVLVLQGLQRFQYGVRVGIGAVDTVIQHRLQQRGTGVGLGSQALARASVGRAGHSHHRAGQTFADQPELAAAVQAQRVGLFAVRQRIFHVQHAAGHFQPA